MARLAILEDQTLFANLLRTAFESQPQHEFLWAAVSGEEFRHKLQSKPVDVVLLDLNLPDCDGVEIAREVLAASGDSPRVLIVSGVLSEAMVVRALTAGVHGFVDKCASIAEILSAVTRVASGQRYISTTIEDIYRKTVARGISVSRLLTRTELRLLPSLASGWPNEKIGDQHGLAASTVQTHRRNIMAKFKVSSTTQLVQFALNQGIINQRPDGSISAPPW